MDEITAPYGYNGRNGGGDTHVTELLARSVDGQADATGSYDLRIEQLRASGASPYGLDDSNMAALRVQWTASLFWMMCTSFLDGIIVQRHAQGESSLSSGQYRTADELCDAATETIMLAIQASATADNKAPVKLKLPIKLPLNEVSAKTSNGVWASCATVIAEVGLLIEQHQAIGIPVRMMELHASMTSAYAQQVQVFNYLNKQWLAAQTSQSKEQAAKQLLDIADEVFKIGLKLTSPALHGREFVLAQKRKLRPDELDLGFDQWILTDPILVADKQKDQTAVMQLAEFWESVSDPQAALTLYQEMSHAVANRFVRRRTGRGYANIVPWPSQFMAIKPWKVSGTQFEVGDLMSFYPRRTSDGTTIVEIRKTGKIKRPFDLLGQY